MNAKIAECDDLTIVHFQNSFTHKFVLTLKQEKKRSLSTNHQRKKNTQI